MSSVYIYPSKSLSELRNQLQTQRDNPTKTLNQYLLRGVTKSELEAFLHRNLTNQFSWDKKRWSGLVAHVTWTERHHGWKFNVDVRKFVSTDHPGDTIQVTSVGGKREVDDKAAIEQGSDMPNRSQGNADATWKATRKGAVTTDSEVNSPTGSQDTTAADYRLEEILGRIHAHLLSKVSSLAGMTRFVNSGIEAWFKVEVQAALGHYVTKLNNKGPDLLLADGQQVELKGATNFSRAWFRSGALKYGCPCLFLGHTVDRHATRAFDADMEVALVGLKELADTGWWVGIITPNADSSRSLLGQTGANATNTGHDRANNRDGASSDGCGKYRS